VVIENEDIHSEALCRIDRQRAGSSAVNRDQDITSSLGNPANDSFMQAVTFLVAMGDEIAYICTPSGAKPRGKGCRGHPIHVVVAVHHNPGTRADTFENLFRDRNIDPEVKLIQ
jgi:hypothetical protein